MLLPLQSLCIYCLLKKLVLRNKSTPLSSINGIKSKSMSSSNSYMEISTLMYLRMKVKSGHREKINVFCASEKATPQNCIVHFVLSFLNIKSLNI